MASTKKDVKKLQEKDTYSLILFGLYQLMTIPEYSSISEMAYVLDKENMLNLCEFFGGQTIRIPTISEMEDVVNALLIYQAIKIDGKSYSEAVKSLEKSSESPQQLHDIYKKMSSILDEYDFNTGRE